MKSTGKRIVLTAALVAGLLFTAGPAWATKVVAKVTKYTGEVSLLAGGKVIPVSYAGQPIIDGSRIQTKKGRARVTFNDGAVLRVNPFSNAMIQEREEETGFLFFKKKSKVRRLTVFVGKLWFKSGSSRRKNYLQTPTAVCGLRGSDADWGYDNLNSYLNMFSGEAQVVGKVLRGVFSNPGLSASQKNQVYQRLAQANAKLQAARDAARAAGLAAPKPLDVAKAMVDAMAVAADAAQLMKQNPSGEVNKRDGELAAQAAAAGIAAAETKVAVEEIRETIASAETEAQDMTGEEKTAAEEAAAAAAGQLADAEAQAAAAAAAAAAATGAANAGDTDALQKAVDETQKATQEVEKIKKQTQKDIGKVVSTTTTVAPTTTVETTIVDPDPETTSIETTATTSVLPTTTTSTTTTTTTSRETTVSP